MSFLSFIPIIGDLINRTGKIIEEVVVDKDKQNEIIQNLKLIEQSVYITELQTKTVPWVDAIHKMGRQALAAASIGAAVYLKVKGYDLDMQTLLMLGAPNIAYQLVKGKGK